MVATRPSLPRLCWASIWLGLTHRLPPRRGLQDQREAMRWVHRNAKGLNIDPTLVTIFGESAGAADTTAHLSAARSQGLFTRAAMESGNNCPWASHALGTASAQFDALAIALKCPAGAAAAACMRKVNATELVTAAHSLPVSGGLTDWAAVVDGVELNVTLMDPSSAISTVPVLLGTNRDEGTEFTKCKTTANQTDLDEWMGAHGQLGASPEQVALLKAQYPTSRYNKTTFATAEWWASVRMVGDYAMTCPARRTARHHAAASTHPVWLYFFDHKPVLVDAIEAFTKKPMGKTRQAVSPFPLIYAYYADESLWPRCPAWLGAGLRVRAARAARRR